MRFPPRILIADDSPASLDILRTRLVSQGYEVVTATDGQEAVDATLAHLPDLILLDVMMPKRDGFEVCRLLRADPIAAVYPNHPRHRQGRHTRHRRRPRQRRRRVPDQARRPRCADRPRAINSAHQGAARPSAGAGCAARRMEPDTGTRVAEQLAELERIGRLKRFLSPQVAELVVSSGAEHLLDSHRRDVAVVFCDLRGFTAFGEAAEPEEVMRVVGEYHLALGALIHDSREPWRGSPATGSWCCSTTRCPALTRICEPCAWRLRCATGSRNSQRTG